MFSDPTHNIEQLDLQSGMKVADLGCGSGFYSMASARAVGDKGRVYAVDVQKDLLARVKKEAANEGLFNVEVVWGNAEKIGGTNLKDNLADAVIVANVLFQIERKDDFIEEIKRILKPKGRILVVDWQDSFGGMGPKRENVITRAVGRQLFESRGFVFEKDIRAGSHHWGVVMRKS